MTRPLLESDKLKVNENMPQNDVEYKFNFINNKLKIEVFWFALRARI